jgi:hypothetical protein
VTWRDTNKTNMQATLQALPGALGFTSRGWMVLIGGGHTYHDQHHVAAGGRFFTRTGTLEISSPSRKNVAVDVTTDGDGDQHQLEDAVKAAVADKKMSFDFTFTVLKQRRPSDDN